MLETELLYVTGYNRGHLVYILLNLLQLILQLDVYILLLRL
jgi:hypothetical protein